MSEKHAWVCKADNVTGEEVPAGIIHIVNKMPPAEGMTLGDLGRFYDEQAAAIMYVLIGCLPGGVLSRVFARLAEYYANFHRVLDFDTDKGGNDAK